jgi:hypothetical protein
MERRLEPARAPIAPPSVAEPTSDWLPQDPEHICDRPCLAYSPSTHAWLCAEGSNAEGLVDKAGRECTLLLIRPDQEPQRLWSRRRLSDRRERLSPEYQAAIETLLDVDDPRVTSEVREWLEVKVDHDLVSGHPSGEALLALRSVLRAEALHAVDVTKTALMGREPIAIPGTNATLRVEGKPLKGNRGRAGLGYAPPTHVFYDCGRVEREVTPAGEQALLRRITYSVVTGPPGAPPLLFSESWRGSVDYHVDVESISQLPTCNHP